MATIALKRLRRIVELLRPRLILTVGKDVATLVEARHPKNPEARPGMIGEWEGILVPMYHPAAFGLLTNTYRDRVATVIRNAVASMTHDPHIGG